jgi:hypothetical protein
VAGGRIGSFVSQKAVCGLQMCQLCVGRSLIFFVWWEKNKNHSVGQRVGLDAVQLQYGLNVFGHLSKWFVFVLRFKLSSVCCLVNGRPTIGYIYCIIVNDVFCDIKTTARGYASQKGYMLSG